MKLQPILVDELVDKLVKVASDELCPEVFESEGLEYAGYVIHAQQDLEDTIKNYDENNVIADNKDFLCIYNHVLDIIKDTNDSKMIKGYKYMLEEYAKIVDLDSRTTTDYIVNIYDKVSDEYNDISIDKDTFDKIAEVSTIMLEKYGVYTDLGLSREIVAKEDI